MNTRRRTLRALPAALVLPAHAQPAWPSKPIRFVVPCTPGGSSEIVARTLAVELSKSIG
jgi:tripartite-type tricarboxylate transporter receptor subunit TctC